MASGSACRRRVRPILVLLLQDGTLAFLPAQRPCSNARARNAHLQSNMIGSAYESTIRCCAGTHFAGFLKLNAHTLHPNPPSHRAPSPAPPQPRTSKPAELYAPEAEVFVFVCLSYVPEDSILACCNDNEQGVSQPAACKKPGLHLRLLGRVEPSSANFRPGASWTKGCHQLGSRFRIGERGLIHSMLL